MQRWGARWRIELGPRRPRYRQRRLPFLERAERLDRRIKRSIVVLTVAVLTVTLVGTATGRYAVAWVDWQARQAVRNAFGIEPDRAEVDALWSLKRRRANTRTREVLANYYQKASPEVRRLFDVAAMAPETGLIRWGRGDDTFLISAKVFEPDNRGRSYRLRPNLRSVWLRQVTLRDGPFGMFLVADEPEVREAAREIHAIVDDHSSQLTNAWGCRGREPDVAAPVRGIVLGDSFMLAMFNSDQETPAVYLENALREALGVPVSILNTGHIGYAPEQYYFTLLEYGDRFRPQFVVVSVCPNDFGEYYPVLDGKGDGYDEASYWLRKLTIWCRGRHIACVLAPVPCERQVVGPRHDGNYPGRINNLFEGTGPHYCSPLEAFIDEHLRLTRERSNQGERESSSPLFNERIKDNHFSPEGAALWAKVVARRILGIEALRQAETNARASVSTGEPQPRDR